jgi:flavin-dependent dehydrogenase
VIRVRRAGLRLVGDGFATVGEAGSMVIPAHASGIATGMFAGHALGVHLGALLRDGGDPTTAALWPWAAAYQRGRGAVLASYDANRRFFESLDPLRDVDPLFVNGVADPADVHATANASPIRLDPRSLPRRLAGAVRAPRAALGFLAGLPKIALVEHHWRRYPLAWDLDTFAAWRQTAMQLLP